MKDNANAKTNSNKNVDREKILEELKKNKDKGGAWWKLLIAVLSVILLVSPFDLILDWIPIVGGIDDIGYIVTAIVTIISAFSGSKTPKSNKKHRDDGIKDVDSN
ncbi:MAG: DUF1232 domain-containing protein [Clostridia bacterium]|nr:DUF1232 domain-containing protein [Clostridia bacterium]